MLSRFHHLRSVSIAGSCFRTSPIRIRASASNNSGALDGAARNGSAVGGEQVEEERRKIVSGSGDLCVGATAVGGEI
ncbi:hypothetical protein AKJ16_DCAP22963 [Drosera capensis]